VSEMLKQLHLQTKRTDASCDHRCHKAICGHLLLSVKTLLQPIQCLSRHLDGSHAFSSFFTLSAASEMWLPVVIALFSRFVQ